MTGVKDLQKRVEVLRELRHWLVVITLARVDKFCLVIVAMCGLRTDYRSGEKKFVLQKDFVYNLKILPFVVMPFLTTNHFFFDCFQTT